jgi:hypothetical protein
VGKLDQREGGSVEHGRTVGEVGNSEGELSSHSVPRSQCSFLLSRIFGVPYYTIWSLIGTQDEFCSARTQVFFKDGFS